MIPRIPEVVSTGSGRRAFAIVGNTMPPRDPDDDEENRTDEPPVVREPDED